MIDTTQTPSVGLRLRHARLFRFASVGACATLAYIGLASAFHALLPLSAAISSGLAYSICAIGSYFGHRYFTFRSNQNQQHNAKTFFLLTFSGYILSMIIPAIVSDWLGWSRLLSTMLTSIIIPVCSAFLTSRLAFGVSLVSRPSNAKTLRDRSPQLSEL
jgi:putative flippase GtrA